jgi:ABC-type phosphate/phosphonate transport system substrate-binding protein
MIQGAVALLALTTQAVAADHHTTAARAPTKVAYQMPGTTPRAPGRDAAPLILTAPPRDSAEEGASRFGPVAAYLSEVLGRKVVYEHPVTWGAYQADMQQGRYDLVFDAPHFNGWRVEKLGHNVLLKIQGDYTYAAFVRQDNAKITDIKQLAGHKICAHAPPHLGTLILFDQFDNPSRQPAVIVRTGYDRVYQSLLAGECTAAVLSLKHLAKFDPDASHTRVVFKHRALPNQGLSAGPRLSADEQEKIAQALLTPTGEQATAAFREAYLGGKGLVRAANGDYAGLGDYLRNEWGYY